MAQAFGLSLKEVRDRYNAVKAAEKKVVTTVTGGTGNDATSLQGVPIADVAPTTTQTLTYNGTQWVPMTTTAGTY
jgi:putative NADPH-quinone reductase